MAAAAGTGLEQSPSHRKRTRAQRSFTAEDAQVNARHRAARVSRGTTVRQTHLASDGSPGCVMQPLVHELMLELPRQNQSPSAASRLLPVLRDVGSLPRRDDTCGAHGSRWPMQAGGYGAGGWHGQGNACFESLDAGGKLEAAKQAATAIEDAYARYRQRQTARDLRRFQLSSMCAVLVSPLLIGTQNLCRFQTPQTTGSRAHAVCEHIRFACFIRKP